MIASRRRALALGALALGGLGACAALRSGGDPSSPLPPIPLPADSPLVSHGGLALNRHAMGFGGLSGLHIDSALNYTAISDLGHWVQGRLVPGADGVPIALADLRSGRLRQDFPMPLPRPLMRDAESLARQPDGSWLVGFERWQRICTYRDFGQRCEPVLKPPPGLEQAPPNAGLESLAVLADGRWLAISEGLEAGPRPQLRAWIGHPGAWTPLRYKPEERFVPTDATPLPDGGALVVERRFGLRRGFRGLLRHLPASQLANPAPDALLEPETLFPADTLSHDNWEGVTTFRYRDALWLALQVDDNEMFFQQGMLLFFSFRR